MKHVLATAEDFDEYPDDMFPLGSVITLRPAKEHRPQKLDEPLWNALNLAEMRADATTRKFSAIRGGAPSPEEYVEELINSGENISVMHLL